MPKKNFTLITICPFCEKHQHIVLDKDDYDKYEKGGDIQECFPNLSADEREAIMTGVCPRCWDLMCSDED